MAKALDFNKIQKHYLTITLSDEQNTTLMISTPTKTVMEDVLILQKKVDAVADGEATVEELDDLYAVCAKLMSRNKTGAKITSEFLSNIFDFEDISIFFNAYMAFIDEVVGSKN